MVVVVDCPPASPAPAMRVGGMSVLERILRDAARQGAVRALVRGDPAYLPPLPALPLAVDIVAPGTPDPDAATVLPGDTLGGVRITDEPSRRAAQSALLQSCRRPYDGLGDRYVIRPISLRITALLTRLPVTPNQVTLANIAIGLAACLLAARGTRASFAAAGALIVVQVILDSCDGELARLRHLSSRLGMWLDNVSDDVIDNLFVAAVGFGMGGPWKWIGAAVAALRGYSAVVIFRAVAAAGTPGDVLAFRWWFDRAGGDASERFNSPGLRSGLRVLGRRDSYLLLWGAACAAGLPVIALCLGAAIGGSYFVLAVIHQAVGGLP